MQTTMSGATPYPHAFVKAVCDVLGQVGGPGLDGAEIDYLLSSIGVAARPVGFAKPEGLCVILFIAQLKDPDRVTRFIARAMNPDRHVKNRARFDTLRRQLVEAMWIYGLTVDDEGGVMEPDRISGARRA